MGSSLADGIAGSGRGPGGRGAAPESSLSGQVATVVSVGTQVSEGSVLVTVKTLTGTAPAARANCSGKVVSVEVAPGSQIAADQVVAAIQP